MVAEVELTVKHYFSSFPLTTRLSLFIKLFESLKKKNTPFQCLPSHSSFLRLNVVQGNIFIWKCGSHSEMRNTEEW